MERDDLFELLKLVNALELSWIQGLMVTQSLSHQNHLHFHVSFHETGLVVLLQDEVLLLDIKELSLRQDIRWLDRLPEVLLWRGFGERGGRERECIEKSLSLLFLIDS